MTLRRSRGMAILVLLILFSVATCSLFAWGDDDTVSVIPGNYGNYTSFNNAWCIAASKDTAYAVWNTANDEVWFARSTDNTETWGDSVKLSASGGRNWYPSIAIANDTVVHVAWRRDTYGYHYYLYYNNSFDKGETWGTAKNIAGGTTYTKYNPCIRATGSYVYVAWQENDDIYFDRSTNNGTNWNTDQNISNVSGSDRALYPSMAIAGQNVDVVWQHYDAGKTDKEIYHRRNTSYGAPLSWNQSNNVSDDSTKNQEYPCVADANNFIHVVWEEDDKIWHSRSMYSGSSWNERQLYNLSTQHYPSIAVTGANVHVVWEHLVYIDEEEERGNYEIYYARSYNSGYSWRGTTCISSYNSVKSSRPSIDVITDNQDSDKRNLYVVWTEQYIGGGHFFEVLADYEQYDYVVGTDPEKGGEEMISGPGGNEIGVANVLIFPNPTSSSTSIRYTLPKQMHIGIEIYDIAGRKIRTLLDGRQIAGTHAVAWDGKDEHGVQVKPSIYFVKSNGISSSKIIKLK